MGKRSRRKAREVARRLVSPMGLKHTLPEGQRMARVNVETEQWAEFLQASAARGGSVADYLGHLVTKEVRRVRRRQWREAATAVSLAPEPVADSGDTRGEVM